MEKYLDEILSSAIKKPHIAEKHSTSFSDNNEWLLYVQAIRVLVENNLIQDLGGSKYRITPNGIKIKKGIGVEKYLEKTLLKQEREEQKLINDAKISNWKAKTFWWFFVFASIGFGLSVYNFINSLTIKEYTQPKGITPEEMESELSKLRTLILDQKNLDSLNNPNYEPKTQNP